MFTVIFSGSVAVMLGTHGMVCSTDWMAIKDMFEQEASNMYAFRHEGIPLWDAGWEVSKDNPTFPVLSVSGYTGQDKYGSEETSFWECNYDVPLGM